MTQSLSFIVADRPPAMYRSEAVAIVVSRISMNVGTTTAVATYQVDRRTTDGGWGQCHAAHYASSAADQRPPDKHSYAHLDHASPATDRGAWFPAASLWYPVSVCRCLAINWLMIANNTAVDSPKNRRPLMASRGPSNRHRSDSRTSP